MDRALRLLEANIEEARNLTGVFEFLEDTIVSPLCFDDLLRAQLIYSVSAFDKFLHDLIISGMVETFNGQRVPTSKYLSEGISIDQYQQLKESTTPSFLFEQIVRKKLSKNSYQEPSKVAEGLSLIWSEPHKWNQIADALGRAPHSVRTELKLIVDRRNAIVHEADIDPLTDMKVLVLKGDIGDALNFIDQCAHAIYDLVTQVN